MSSALEFEYNTLIGQISDISREITAYRQRLALGDTRDWHQDLEPILERHRAVTARLREVVAMRASS